MLNFHWARACVFFLALASTHHLSAAFTLQNGRFVTMEEAVTMMPTEHFNRGVDAMQCGDWKEAARQFRIVVCNFPETPLAQEAAFFGGVANYNMEEFDAANEEFSTYLKTYTTPQYFEETLSYKFYIANQFRCGAKRRLFCSRHLPKWASGYDLALEIYDEIIVTVPCHELAVQALYMKAAMLWEQCSFRESVDTYHQIIRRFPRHELAPQSYLEITNVYLAQAQLEAQNTDLLELAQVAVRKFEIDFPGDERVYEAQSNVQRLKEVYACGLFETGQFYERTCRPFAAVLYYRKAMSRFPDTNVATHCFCRLQVLDPNNELTLPIEVCSQENQEA